MNKTVCRIILAFFIFMILPISASADDWYEKDAGYFTMYDNDGSRLTMMAREMLVDDEYIAEDNKQYVIKRVDKNKKSAYAEFVKDIELPEFEKIKESKETVAIKEDKKGNILIYCTHTDESYIDGDGTHSKPGAGGILDIAELFKTRLEEKGAPSVIDKTPHDPHDAGAYRRSRKTAIDLIKNNMPVTAIFDLHRDAVPPEAYQTKVNGEPMSKVRIVLGRRNQNIEANKELAVRIKAIADKAYPGLIKDIYIGKGAYNQEISPRSLILEFGAHKNSKESVQKATGYMADVVVKSLYGGEVQDEKNKKDGQEAEKYNVKPINQTKKQGGGSGIIWVLLLTAAGIVAFVFISTGNREFKAKFLDIFKRKNK